MLIHARIELEEDENEKELAKRCRMTDYCPWPLLECPMEKKGIRCRDVKAKDWKDITGKDIILN